MNERTVVVRHELAALRARDGGRLLLFAAQDASGQFPSKDTEARLAVSVNPWPWRSRLAKDAPY